MEIIKNGKNDDTYSRFSDTITIGTGAAHTAGDVVSTDAGEILEFDLAGLIPPGGSGIIVDSLTILGQNAVFSGGVGYTLEIFTISPTVQATNVVYDLADADIAGYVAPLTISTLIDKGSNCRAYDTGHNIYFKLTPGDTKLYGKLVANGTETTVTGKVITITIGVAAL